MRPMALHHIAIILASVVGVALMHSFIEPSLPATFPNFDLRICSSNSFSNFASTWNLCIGGTTWLW